MSEMTIFLTLTEGWSSAHASRKLVREARWNSSGNTCTIFNWCSAILIYVLAEYLPVKTMNAHNTIFANILGQPWVLHWSEIFTFLIKHTVESSVADP
jgi:hypothetical protein